MPASAFQNLAEATCEKRLITILPTQQQTAVTSPINELDAART